MRLPGMFEVLLFHATICLSAGFSLFNQSNMTPGELIPLEMYIHRGFWEVTVWLSRAALKTKDVFFRLREPPSVLKGVFLLV